MKKSTKDKKRFKSREARKQHMLRVKNIHDINNLTVQQAVMMFNDFIKVLPTYDKDRDKDDVLEANDLDEDEVAFVVGISKYFMNKGYELGIEHSKDKDREYIQHIEQSSN